MILRCLFGQARENYDGEHAPELICAADEYMLEDNPEYWEALKKETLKNGYADNFVAMQEINVEVDQFVVRKLLNAQSIPGRIK